MKKIFKVLSIVSGALLSFPFLAIAGFDQEESNYLINMCGETFLRCPDNFEEQQIEKESPYVTRDSATLSLAIERNTLITLSFKDNRSNGEGFRKYTYLSYFRDSGYYLVHLGGYEGRSYIYVDVRTGRINYSSGFRYFSPNGSFYATSHIDIDYEYPNNWVSIIGSEKEDKIVSLEYIPQKVNGHKKYTGPKKLKWLGDKKILIEELSFTVGPDLYESGQAFLELVDGGWVYSGDVNENNIKITNHVDAL